MMAPKQAETVEYNHEGTWCYALIEKEGVGGPGNYDLIVFPDTSPVERFSNVPQGDESGHWR
jgi:hypothetical protein